MHNHVFQRACKFRFNVKILDKIIFNEEVEWPRWIVIKVESKKNSRYTFGNSD